MNRHRWAIAGIISATLAIGCAEEDPVAAIAKANAAVAAQEDVVEVAEQLVITRQKEVIEAQENLAEAKGKVRTEESKLARLESEVDRGAMDTVLFRSVQKRLLDDAQLSQVAIVAGVEKGVVTLSGSVENSKLRDRAIEVAGGTKGVKSVQSRIAVSVSATTPAAK